MKNYNTIVTYYKNKDNYKSMCEEVSFILKKKLSEGSINIVSIKSRVKDLDSFLEKIERKGYSDPFIENLDFAGVRVIYMYKDEHKRINDIIENAFDIVDYTDKENDNILGYPGKHYVIKLKKSMSGYRADELSDYCCEIQVRTNLEDAWSNIDHDLKYKKESQLPENIIIELNDFIALFRIVDRYFIRLRNEIHDYRQQLNDKNDNELLKEKLNIEVFRAYIYKLMPQRSIEAWPGQLHLLYDQIIEYNITLPEIKDALSSTKQTREKVEKELIDDYLVADKTNKNKAAAVPHIAWALMLKTTLNDKYNNIPQSWHDAIAKYRTF